MTETSEPAERSWVRYRILAVIASCGLAATAIDLFLLPPGPRPDVPSNLPMAVLLVLFVSAYILSVRVEDWRMFALVVAGLSLLTFMMPILRSLQGVDMSLVFERRAWGFVAIWSFAIMVISRKRYTMLLERTNRALEARVAEKTAALRSALSEVNALNRRLIALADVAFDAIVVTDDGIIRDVKSTESAMFGYPLAEIAGHHVLDYVAPAFVDTARRSLALEQTPGPVEMGLKASDGSTAYVELAATDVTIDDCKLRVLGLRDISDRLALEREIVTIAEQERTRIGLDLHDHVGQVLVSTKWAAQKLVDALGERHADLVGQGHQVVELIEQSIREAQRVSTRLAPPILSSEEIYPALSVLSVDVNRHTGVTCSLRCPRREKLTRSEANIHLYRIAEEGVSNALKHSGGKHIDLIFERNDDTYTLEVLDDGIGISPDTQRTNGVGLRSIRYRARLIEGTVDIARRPEGGTRIACTFPV